MFLCGNTGMNYQQPLGDIIPSSFEIYSVPKFTLLIGINSHCNQFNSLHNFKTDYIKIIMFPIKHEIILRDEMMLCSKCCTHFKCLCIRIYISICRMSINVLLKSKQVLISNIFIWFRFRKAKTKKKKSAATFPCLPLH